MTGGFKIGRIFGVNIRIDWSWLFIFFLITWNLSFVFGQAHPDWSTTMRWGMASIASLLFFVSILAHELAHSIVARSQGVPVRGITLFLFGGVSNIQREPESPISELLITIVGPITSIVLGVSLVLLVVLTTSGLSLESASPAQFLTDQSPVSTLLLWLGSVNVLVGLFNLIPGFPLDGGRIVRSLLWAITKDLRQATRWASALGSTIAWLMIGAGIAMVLGVRIPFLGTGPISGLWLAFIGWFLNTASRQSYQQVVIRDLLEDIPVERIMRKNPPHVSPELNLDSLVYDYMMGSDEQAFPVIKDSELIGIITLDDVRSVDRSRWSETLVKDSMRAIENVEVIRPDEDAADALTRLNRREIRQLPVVEGGQLLGVLRRRDVLRWLQLHAQGFTAQSG